MEVGLALTVAATIVPFIDRGTSDLLGDHIRAMYPDYTDSHVSSAATTYLIYLSIIGVFGVAAWLWTIRIARKRAGRAWIFATAMFLLGSTIALTNLFIQEETGDRALPALYGIVGLLPTLPGLAAVAVLWKADRLARLRDQHRAEPAPARLPPTPAEAR
jgi:hypothetical protein